MRRPGAELEWDWIAGAILSMIGTPRTLDDEQEQALRNMMATEITQLAISSPDLGRVIEESGGDGAIDAAAARRVIRALARDRRASRTLRDYSAKALRSR